MQQVDLIHILQNRKFSEKSNLSRLYIPEILDFTHRATADRHVDVKCESFVSLCRGPLALSEGEKKLILLYIT